MKCIEREAGRKWRWTRLLTLLVILLGACLATPPRTLADAPFNGTGFFVADDDGATLENPSYMPALGQGFQFLRPQVYRLMIPWNAKEGPNGAAPGTPAYIRYEWRLKWVARTHSMIDRAKSLGVQQIILTLRSNTSREWGSSTPDAYLPNPVMYEIEAAKMVKEFASKVDAWGGINEPNLWPKADGTSSRAIPVSTLTHFQASIAEVVKAWDPTATITSPDFNDETKNWKSYVENFKKAYPENYSSGDGFGNVAAFHPYAAVENKNLATVGQYAGILPAGRSIWVTEAGAKLQPNLAGQLDKVNWMANASNGLASHDRVTRIGYYHMRDHNQYWDTALLNSDLSPRASWKVWCAAAHGNNPNHSDCVGYGLPIASTGGATNISSSRTATLSGTVNPMGFNASYRFEWGTTIAYGNAVPVPSAGVGAGTANVAVSQSIGGLKGQTTYHFRIAASTSTGTRYGVNQQFTTPDWRPSTQSLDATEIKYTTATLNANINPNGSATTYHFQYGSDTEYGSSVPVPSASIGAGTQDVGVSQTLSGLKAGRVYHFRVVAINQDGTRFGDDKEFTTEAVDGDVDGDGHADLTTIDSSGTAQVFAGTTSGLLGAAPTASLLQEVDRALLDSQGHYVVDTADVTGDGRSDLITVKDEGKVMVHLGAEERTFEAALDAGISLPPVMNSAGPNEPIGVADVTGDGFDDLVAFVGPGNGSIKVHKGQVDGKFATTAVTSLEGSLNSALTDAAGSYFVDVGDVDGDGHADLVAMNTNGTTYAYKGQGDGKFSSAVSAATVDPILDNGTGHEPIGLGDVSGDGRDDLLTLDGSGTLKLFKGQESGAFATATTAYGTAIDSSLLDGVGNDLNGLSDYNADGLDDLVISNANGELSTYEAQEGATFDAPVAQSGSISTVRHDPAGHEVATQKPLVRRVECMPGGCTWPPHPVAESDVNGDGRSDLVALDQGGTPHVFRGTVSGLAVSNPVKSLEGELDPALLDGVGHYLLDVADVDGDGRADQVTWTHDGKVLVHRGRPDGSFGEGAKAVSSALVPAMNGGGLEPVAVADINGDGRGDLLVHHFLGFIVAIPGKADGTFGGGGLGTVYADSALLDGEGHYFLGAGDVNGDGYADLVSADTEDDQLRLFEGSAEGFKYLEEGNVGTPVGEVDPILDDGLGEEPVGLGDVDGDGHADLLTLDGSTLALRLGAESEEEDGSGTFEAPIDPYGSSIDSNLLDASGMELIGLLDYSRDGRADLVALGPAGEILVYRAKADATFAAPVAHEGDIESIRNSATGLEFATEQPFIRRAGCTDQGCSWPPVPPAADWALQSATKPAGSTSSTFASVSCPSDEACMAVGRYQTGGGSKLLAESWDGESWEVHSMPEPTGTNVNPMSVSCVSANDCTMVGIYLEKVEGNNYARSFAERWNGSEWTVQSLFSKPTGSYALQDVSCASASACIAVGHKAGGLLAEHWNGSSWSPRTVPLPPEAEWAELSGVSCAAEECTAVGYWMNSEAVSPLVEKWDGSKWTVFTSPQAHEQQPTYLEEVSCVSGGCVAVGAYEDGTGYKPFAANWDGSKWLATTVFAPPGAVSSYLHDVSCSSLEECIAVGGYEGKVSKPFAVGWNASEWSLQSMNQPFGVSGGHLGGLSCSSPHTCTAVGTGGVGSLPLVQRKGGPE